MIQLDQTAINQALPLVSVGLQKYCWLQAAIAWTDVANDGEFQTRFNGFYRVRRNAAWRFEFYKLLQEAKSEPRPFAEVLCALYATTGKVEASFASKLAATVDPGKPVVDSFVLRNLGLRLPRYGAANTRIVRIVDLHDRLREIFSDYLSTDMGRYLMARFQESYPKSQLTGVKMLDLVLWQTRWAA